MKFNTIREFIDGFDESKYDLNAFILKKDKATTDITYKELHEAIKSLAYSFLELGITKGDKIAILSENRYEWPVVYLAATTIGAIIVPIDIFSGILELSLILSESETKLIFTSRQFISKIDKINPSLEKLEKIICFDEHELLNNKIDKNTTISTPKQKQTSTNQKIILFNSIIKNGKTLLSKKNNKYLKTSINPQDISVMIHMHETKFAMLTHEGIMANADSIIQTLSVSKKYLQPNDIWLANLPFHHTYPAMMGFIVPLLTNGTIVILTRFKIKDILDIIIKMKVNYLASVPEIIGQIYKTLKKINVNKNELNNLKFLISGGAPISKEVLTDMNNLGIPVLQGYGLSEYSPVVSTTNLANNKIGSIGKPLPNVTVEIAQPDLNGNGEILVKGPSIMKGYYNMPEETEKVITKDGWLHTGDIGRIDNEGFLYITGRLKNIIINKGGKNIYPHEIESILNRNPYISQVMVISKIDANKGEYAYAIIHPDFQYIAEIEKKLDLRLTDNKIETLIDKEIQKISLNISRFKIPEDFEISYESLENKYNSLSQLHPLINKNIFSENSYKFYKIINKDEFIIKDHLIRDRNILPGSAYIEMARAASEFTGVGEIKKLKNIIWSYPLEIQDHHKELNITLKPYNNIFKFVITSIDNNNTLHCQGEIDYNSNGKPLKQKKIDINKFKEWLGNKKDIDKFYNEFKSFDLNYGPNFKCITELYYNEYESLSKIVVPENLKRIKDLILNPIIIDAVFQTCSGINFKNETDKLYLPFSMGEIKILQPLTNICYGHSEAIGNGDKNLKKFNLYIYDENGNELVIIEKFIVRSVKIDLFMKTIKKTSQQNKQIDKIYYKPEWINSKIQIEERSINSILIFDNDDKLFNTLIQQNKNAILVKSSNKYCEINSNIFEIDPTDINDYLKLFKILIKKNITPENIIHLWNNSDLPFKTNSYKQLEENLKSGIYSIFKISKSLMQLKIKNSIKLLYFFQESSENIQPLNSAVSGFMKTIRLENPKYQFSSICLEKKDISTKEISKIIFNELQSSLSNQTEIKYSLDNRKIKHIINISLNDKRQLLKKEGIYLITGGTGGLGLIFAGYLSEKYKAKIILTGRSDLTNEKNGILNKIEKLGGKILYIKSDVNKLNSINDVIKESKNKFGNINGIIHSAGIIEDTFIIQKDKTSFDKVISPKINGTINLDKAFQNENLDFFLMFSSLTSITGNIGQCDYAVANSFLDEFAYYRNLLISQNKRSGITISINWPLWKDGGMHLDNKNIKLLRDKSGIDLLEKSKGIQALEDALNNQINQLIVIDGDKNKIDNFLGIKTPTYQLQDDLIKIVSKVLNIPEAEIDIETDLSEFGIDSISLMAMLNILEENLGQTVTPDIAVENPTIKLLSKYLSMNIIENEDKQKNINNNKKNYFIPSIDSNKIDNINKIAIIGISGRFPGSPSTEQFWENLKNGAELITEVPASRFNIKDYYSQDKEESNKSYVNKAGFINDIDLFDAVFFGISDNDAIVMDPQHRILLEQTQELLDRAGYKKSDVENSKTGIYIGGAESPYVQSNKDMLTDLQMQHYIVNRIQNMMAARISDFYNLKGPAYTIDTACSSSLVAIHNACQSIINGKNNMAIAGGVELLINEDPFIGFSKAKVLSEDCKSYVFDEKANGFVLGEGCGLVLLKHLNNAIIDGDNILAVISGSSINNDGHTMGLTTPNMNGQQDVIKDALKNAKITPDSITYLEAHGTGTLLGDPIEIKAATNVYKEYSNKIGYCAVGSVKSNIGHLLHAAGVASLLKVILCLKHKKLVPTLNCSQPHKRFKFDESPFYPITTLKNWNPINNLRRAAVSSFGFGGTNCHLIVEEFPVETYNYTEKQKPVQLTKFNRKQYWLGKEIIEKDDPDNLEKNFYRNILEKVSSGELSPEAAIEFENQLK